MEASGLFAAQKPAEGSGTRALDPLLADGDRPSRQTRIELSLPVTLQVEGGKRKLRGEIRNISAGGMFVAGLNPLPGLGSKLRAAFKLPEGARIKGAATVVRIGTPSGDPEHTGVGVRFDMLDTSSVSTLEAFIEAALSRTATEQVKIKIDRQDLVINAKARSLSDNAIVLESELPFLKLGSEVQLLRDGRELQLGELRWVSLHVPPAGAHPKLAIGVELAQKPAVDGAEPARRADNTMRLFGPPPLKPGRKPKAALPMPSENAAGGADGGPTELTSPTINLDQEIELVQDMSGVIGMVLEEAGLDAKVKRLATDSSLKAGRGGGALSTAASETGARALLGQEDGSLAFRAAAYAAHKRRWLRFSGVMLGLGAILSCIAIAARHHDGNARIASVTPAEQLPARGPLDEAHVAQRANVLANQNAVSRPSAFDRALARRRVAQRHRVALAHAQEAANAKAPSQTAKTASARGVGATARARRASPKAEASTARASQSAQGSLQVRALKQVKLAQRALQQGNLKQAKSCAQTALKLHPGNKTARQLLVKAKQAEQQHGSRRARRRTHT